MFQLEVVTALSRPGLSGVYLVEGPPGTGKTTTIVSIVQTIVATYPVSTFPLPHTKHLRILITAPSNAAVDTLLEKLVISIPSTQNPNVIRLGRVGGDASVKDHPERAFLQKYELDGMVDRQIKKFRSDAANRLSTETDGYLRKKFEQATLMNARVVLLFSVCLMWQIVSTLATSSNTQVTSFLSQGTQLPIVIVDEATQCTEPHCLIPLCVKPSLFILVGDSHQLAATILNPTIKRLGYGKSLFERLVLNKFPRLSLRIQFRMTPSISLWPNQYVYQSQLIDSKRVRQPSFCYIFQNSSVPSYAFLDVPEVLLRIRFHAGNLRQAPIQFS